MRVATEADFDRILESFPAEEPEQPAQASGHNGSRFDAKSFLHNAGVRFREVAESNGGWKLILDECVFDPSHKKPDAAVFLLPSGAIGYRCLHNSCSGRKWRDVREKLDPGCYERKQNGQQQNGPAAEPPKAIIYQRITAAELDAACYALEYLIDNTLVGTQPQIVAGGKKCLKTNLLCDATISLASGLPFLGRFQVARKVRTAFMSGESGLHTIQETCRRICAAKGIALREVEGLVFSPDLPRIDDPRHQQALESFISDLGVEVLVLDPAYLCMPGGDAGNLFIQGEMLRNLSGACEAKKVTLLLCHHTRKGGISDPFEPPELEHIAWAGFQEFARGWWLVGRREKYEPGTGKHKLWLSVGGSAGHSALWGLNINEGVREAGRDRVWEVAVLSAAEARESAAEQQQHSKVAREQARLNQDVKALLEVAAKYPEGETKNVLRTAAALSNDRCAAAIASCLKSGRMVTCELLKSGKKTPIEGFKPAPKPTHTEHTE